MYWRGGSSREIKIFRQNESDESKQRRLDADKERKRILRQNQGSQEHLSQGSQGRSYEEVKAADRKRKRLER